MMLEYRSLKKKYYQRLDQDVEEGQRRETSVFFQNIELLYDTKIWLRKTKFKKKKKKNKVYTDSLEAGQVKLYFKYATWPGYNLNATFVPLSHRNLIIIP